MPTPRRLEDWVDHLADRRLPILPFSKHVLKRIQEESDPPANNELCAIIYRDPALTHHILRLANGLKHRHLQAQVNSLEQAVMMLGIGRVIELPATLEDTADSLPEPNYSGYMRTMSTAYYAACQAWNWAWQRHDMLPAEVFTATLLRHVGALGLWAYGDDVMPNMESLLPHDGVYGDETEYVQLGFTIAELSMALTQHWRLPTLVVENLTPEKVLSSRTLGIVLAARLSHCAHNGWSHPEVRRLLKGVMHYLQIDEEEALAGIRESATQAHRETNFYPSHPYLALLEDTQAKAPPTAPRARFCTVSRPGLLERIEEELNGGDYERVQRELAIKHENVREFDPILALGLRGMHSGIGLSRALFAKYSHGANAVDAYMLRGAETDPFFNRFHLTAASNAPLEKLLAKPTFIWQRASQEKTHFKLPVEVRHQLGVDDFFIGSIFKGHQAFGIFYADRHLAGCELDQRAFEQFKRLAQLVSERLQALE